MKFGTGLLYNKLSKKREFRENRLSDSRTVLKGTMNCYTHFSYFSPISVQFGAEHRH
jgi:hypothetical protein